MLAVLIWQPSHCESVLKRPLIRRTDLTLERIYIIDIAPVLDDLCNVRKPLPLPLQPK
jgi:hypothetical protein